MWWEGVNLLWLAPLFFKLNSLKRYFLHLKKLFSMLVFTSSGIYCPAADVFIDPWKPENKAIITHAHSDHARWGQKAYLAHKDSESILRLRLGEQINLQTVAYEEQFQINNVKFSLHPAGH